MRSFLLFAVLSLTWANLVSAQDVAAWTKDREWTVGPRAVESPLLKYRLLPAEYELRDGNAATILLRLPWDATGYWSQVVPKFSERLNIPLSDRKRILEEGPALYDSLYSELRRAAYRRTAEWEYPVGEQPLSDILLPDVQGSRDIISYGLSIWIRYHIVAGDLDEAREGILVGLADARHYARTPFIICRLVAAAHVNMMLYRLEELIQQPECPNLYWPLTALPTPLIDMKPALEFEQQILPRAGIGLDNLDKPRTPQEWQQLADGITRFFQGSQKRPELSAEKLAERQRQMLRLARTELPSLQPAIAPGMAGMTDAELIVRWAVARWNDVQDRVVAAAALETPLAIPRLQQIEEETKYLVEEGIWNQPPDPLTGWRACLSAAKLERRIAALRIVEGVRHFAATHDGKLPKELSDMTDTPSPVDPLTGKPFGYKANAGSFRLTAEDMEISPNNQSRINLHVHVQDRGSDSVR